jgi:hypothetical protein
MNGVSRICRSMCDQWHSSCGLVWIVRPLEIIQVEVVLSVDAVVILASKLIRRFEQNLPFLFTWREPNFAPFQF